MWLGLDTAPRHCSPVGKGKEQAQERGWEGARGLLDFEGSPWGAPVGTGRVGCPQPRIPVFSAVFHVGMGWRGAAGAPGVLPVALRTFPWRLEWDPTAGAGSSQRDPTAHPAGSCCHPGLIPRPAGWSRGLCLEAQGGDRGSLWLQDPWQGRSARDRRWLPDPRGSAARPRLSGKAGTPSVGVSGLSWVWARWAVPAWSPSLLPGRPRAEFPLLHPGASQADPRVPLGEHETPAGPGLREGEWDPRCCRIPQIPGCQSYLRAPGAFGQRPPAQGGILGCPGQAQELDR